MIVPSDDDYQQTKRLKIEGVRLPSPFMEMVDWIGSHYGVHVLNVFYDTVIPDDCPRLSVILESRGDAQEFYDRDLGNFDRIKRDCVREHFETLVSQQGDRGLKVDGLFVVFAAFESVARIEANESVSEKEIECLKAELNNEDLWEISRCLDGVTFFFYTDAQVKAHEAKGLRDSYAREYARILRPYDQFGYLQSQGVSVCFDSKENFDTNYRSNWSSYYR